MPGLDIRIKRIYEPRSDDDGTRILVDRVWPRGIGKQSAAIDEWLKDVAPSKALRQWFGHRPERWEAFRERYWRELDAQPETVERLCEYAQDGTLTLCFSARDAVHNNAVVLKAYLEQNCGLGKSCG